MAALAHRCPVRGCEVHIPPSKLMCATHWRRVTLHAQYEVLWSRKQAHLSRRHADAIAQAIREAGRPEFAPGRKAGRR